MSFFVSVVALGLYFCALTCLSLVVHPLGYCVLLVGGGLCLSVATLFCWGVSWYLILFILVYVGGVYVLFLFISVHSANSLPTLVGGSPSFYLLLFLLFVLLFSLFFDYVSFAEEESRFLCSSMEGFSYLSLCLSLLIGFMGVSVVSSQKNSFFR